MTPATYKKGDSVRVQVIGAYAARFEECKVLRVNKLTYGLSDGFRYDRETGCRRSGASSSITRWLDVEDNPANAPKRERARVYLRRLGYDLDYDTGTRVSLGQSAVIQNDGSIAFWVDGKPNGKKDAEDIERELAVCHP
jgi:hypothetical protein